MAKKNFINATHVEGLIYNHSLEEKLTGESSKAPGTKYISGTVEIATDDALVNIVPVHYTYVTAVTKAGKENPTYTTLANILNGTYKTIVSDGAENATKIRIDSSIDLNEFYSDRRTGEPELISTKRNEGGFAHTNGAFTDNENLRSTFDVDIVITGVRHVDADPERNTAEKAIVRGCIFKYGNKLLPTEFSVTDPAAINYFEGLDVSSNNPVFTRIKGKQISETIVRQITEESAFGEPSVREVKSSRKDFVITWAKPEPYVWNDESTITVQELKDARADRDLALAALKARYEETKNNRGNAFNTTTTVKASTTTGNTSSNTDFNFDF